MSHVLCNGALRDLYTPLLADLGTSLDNINAEHPLRTTDYAIPTSQWTAIVGAITLARRGGLLPQGAGVVPGDQVFSQELLDRRQVGDLTAAATHSTEEAERLLGVKRTSPNKSD